MPAERLSMRQVREVLRLKYASGHSERRIAVALGISRSTVAEYLDNTHAAVMRSRVLLDGSARQLQRARPWTAWGWSRVAENGGEDLC